MLNHMARRRDMLFLMVLISNAREVTKKKGYELLKTHGPFPIVPVLQEQLETAIPNQLEREKEVFLVQKVVNGFAPLGYLMWRPELKLWFACQITMRLVASGWRFGTDQAQREFIQRTYDLASNINMTEPPSRELITFVADSAQVLRGKLGMFK